MTAKAADMDPDSDPDPDTDTDTNKTFSHKSPTRLSNATPIFRLQQGNAYDFALPSVPMPPLAGFKQHRILLSLIKTFYGLHGQASVSCVSASHSPLLHPSRSADNNFSQFFSLAHGKH